MSVESRAESSQRHNSIRRKRAGAVALGVFVVVYLALITVSFSDRIESTPSVVLFAFLFCLGVVALLLLFRLWRGLSRSTTRRARS